MAILDNILGCWELNETSGTTANDAHTTNNNGTTTGATVNQTGKLDKCYDFDGINDFVTINDGTFMDGLTTFTITQWIKWDGGGDDTSFGSDQQSRLLVTSSGVYQGIMDSTLGRITVLGTTTLSTGTWYHVALTYDGASLKLYINGLLDGSTASSSKVMANATQPVTIGAWGWTTVHLLHWNGLIDQTIVWGRNLLLAEIQEIYNSGNGIEYPFTGPIKELSDNVSIGDNFSSEIIKLKELTETTNTNDSLIKVINRTLTESINLADNVTVPGTATSTSIDYNNGTINKAKMTIEYTGGTPTLSLSADGGSNWETVNNGVLHNFTNTGTDLRWGIAAITSTITKIKIEDYH